ncbi:MAG TPA: sigma-70 family RNA polymerase sigma factor [Polyangia bacterium]
MPSLLHPLDMLIEETLAAARGGDETAFARLVAPHRNELRALCYRMAASLHDADDLLQESLVRAWRGLGAFEGRSSVRTWLYRVTTNACLDVLGSRAARSLPTELGPPAGADRPIGPPRTDLPWLEPCPDELLDVAPSPEARYTQRESVALAFLVAVQLLPPKQRAVLILRDVVGWQASECAELLDLSVTAVNSALQRARETLAARALGGRDRATEERFEDAKTQALLARYVAAWETADVNALVALLHDDATLAMPPLAEWLRGAQAIGAAIAAMLFGPAGAGAFTLVPARANGMPALAGYQRDRATGGWQPMALHLFEIRDDRLAAITAFLDARLFAPFHLPPTPAG